MSSSPSSAIRPSIRPRSSPSPTISTRTSGDRRREAAGRPGRGRPAPSAAGVRRQCRRPVRRRALPAPGADRHPAPASGAGIPFGTNSSLAGSIPSTSAIRRRSARDTVMMRSTCRAISARSRNFRIGWPSNDQVCSCASTTGVAVRGLRAAAQTFEPNLCEWRMSTRSRRSRETSGRHAATSKDARRRKPRNRTPSRSSSASTAAAAGSAARSGDHRLTHRVRSKRVGSSRVRISRASLSPPPISPMPSTSVTTRSLWFSSLSACIYLVRRGPVLKRAAGES